MKKNIIQNTKIKKGDKVYILSGNDRGLTGTVLSRTKDRVVVEGVQMRKKHVKKSKLSPQGGIQNIEGSIHLSNVRPVKDEK